MNRPVYVRLNFPRWFWWLIGLIQGIMLMAMPMSILTLLPILTVGGIIVFAGVACSLMFK